MEDDYTKILPKSVYVINDTDLVEGSALIQYYQSGTGDCMALAGAISIGILIDWMLGFTNKHVEKDKINSNYFTSIVGALIGAAVLGYFSNSPKLLGWYGTTVGIGFLMYSIIYPIAESSNNQYFKKLVNPNYKN